MPRAVISTEKPAEGRQDRIVLVVTRTGNRPQADGSLDYTRRQYFSYDEAADVITVLSKALTGVGRKPPQPAPAPVPRPPGRPS